MHATNQSLEEARIPLSLLEEGERLEGLGRLDEALGWYERAVEADAFLGKGFFLKGNVLLALGRTEDALKAYDKALEIKPDSAGACFNRGNALYRLGRYGDAATAYRQALKLNTEMADAEVALGVVLEELDRGGEAVEHYTRALELKPDYAEVHFNLGSLYLRTSKLNLAEEHFRACVELRPEEARNHRNLAVVLRQRDKLVLAAESYRRSLERDREVFDDWLNLGNLYQDLNRSEEAIHCFEQALKERPDSIDARNNMAVALRLTGDLERSISMLNVALQRAPDQAELLVNKALTLDCLGRHAEAEWCCLNALEVMPGMQSAHSALGRIYLSFGKIEQALACFRTAHEIEPDDPTACCDLGGAYLKTGYCQLALEHFNRALQLDPHHLQALINLGCAYTDIGRFDEAIRMTRKALEFDPLNVGARSNLLFIYNYLAGGVESDLLLEAEEFGRTATGLARRATNWHCSPDPQRMLRIGIVSGDLRTHPVAYFLEAVLSQLSSDYRGHLELVAYPTRIFDDPVSLRLQSVFGTWHPIVGMSDEAAAEQIRADRIDILIDLSGHSAHNRLPVFAWKPAPVQVSWLGYFATTGVAEIDYLIADPWTLLESEEKYFTEKIWRLPETRLCFSIPDENVSVSPLPALTNGHITFGCFNNLSKMNDDVVALWAEILLTIQDSTLCLKFQQLVDSNVRTKVLRSFAQHGITGDRLVLEGYTSRMEYFASYCRVDIALDPFPYPGGTTTVESLWMGVPVLTLTGTRFLSRQGLGLLVNAGLPDWVARDKADYVTKAVCHASDLKRLSTLRAGLREQVMASPIFDSQRFSTHFEEAMRGMWKAWCETQNHNERP